MKHPQVKNNTIRNLQAEPFISYYINGIKAYENKYYDKAIKNFESSVTSYIESEESCRFYCEGPLDHDWNPEFITAFSSKYRNIFLLVYKIINTKKYKIVLKKKLILNE
jgi:hypothetical protein